MPQIPCSNRDLLANLIGLERRQSPRRPVDRSGVCMVVFAEERPCLGTVCDLSADGVSVLVDTPLSIGDEVAVKLFSRTWAFSCVRLLRVLRVTEQADGTYWVGGRFSVPLNPEHLSAFVGRNVVGGTRRSTPVLDVDHECRGSEGPPST